MAAENDKFWDYCRGCHEKVSLVDGYTLNFVESTFDLPDGRKARIPHLEKRCPNCNHMNNFVKP